MHALRELQAECYRAFAEGSHRCLLAQLTGADPGLGILIYTNNLLETRRKTLAATYPVVLRLVGESCFRTLAHDYGQDYPSRSGNLAGFGTHFPELLERLYSGGTFGYLSDVARLEWACEEAFVAGNASPLDLASLAHIPEERLGSLRLQLHPTCRLVMSRYPILSIWRANTEGRDDMIDLHVPERVLVARSGQQLELYPVSASGAAFIGALLDGQDLDTACARAESAEVGFDPAEVLTWLARVGLLVEPTQNQLITD